MRDPLEEELDRLYQLPLSRFTEERNSLAKRLKAAGDGTSAERVKKLPKPSPAAWIVNQLYFTERSDVDALLEGTTRVRQAQEQNGQAELIADATRRRADILQRLKHKAQRIAGEHGQAMSAQLGRQVLSTLETLSGAPDATSAYLGRLHRELSPLGFDALTSAAAVPSQAPATKRSAPRPEPDRSLVEAERIIAQLDQELRQAKRDAEIAETRAMRAVRDAAEADQRARQARELAEQAKLEAKRRTEHAQQLEEQLRGQRNRLPRHG